ncbi:hypothetical protein NM208_g4907 [Fusarium decemcellulare]|uniref:Uncharacterized protein n=1 Tax=Fusarium decemcellulare TaxID=57161 RepID=A0ACC1SJ32_9HYPO|nr:hypothetical protein NM208_g4907 [Fusarium decemcellulare]
MSHRSAAHLQTCCFKYNDATDQARSPIRFPITGQVPHDVVGPGETLSSVDGDRLFILMSLQHIIGMAAGSTVPATGTSAAKSASRSLGSSP